MHHRHLQLCVACYPKKWKKYLQILFKQIHLNAYKYICFVLVVGGVRIIHMYIYTCFMSYIQQYCCFLFIEYFLHFSIYVFYYYSFRLFELFVYFSKYAFNCIIFFHQLFMQHTNKNFIENCKKIKKY